MKNLIGSEKQIAWAETIRENLIKGIEFVERTSQGKQFKVVSFAKWFCEECDNASDFIIFRDAKIAATGTYMDVVAWLRKTASRPELKAYVDKYFAE